MDDEVFGFIGTGTMGLPMALRLLDAGHQLVVYDANDKAMQPLIERGARAATSAAAVASQVETVFVSLPTPWVVRAVALDANGISDGSKVKTFVDLSTTGPRVAIEVAQGLAAKNIVAIDAPVSGGLIGAQRGTLAIMVSGPHSHYQVLEPILKLLGKVFHVGARPGMGQTLKLANNLLSATALAITSEAMVMGVKAGLDPKTMLDVINAGSGRNSATLEKFPRSVLPRTFDFGFTNELLHKDIRLCLEEADALGVPMWVGNAVIQMLSMAKLTQGKSADITTIVKCIEEWAGVEIPKTSS
jgi:3-hydroxyisobutyrate dehydrogenase-like beta-hydroxyacid dehydrogenase